MAGNVGGSKTKQQNLYARVLAEINAGKRTMGSLPAATQKGVKAYRAMRAKTRSLQPRAKNVGPGYKSVGGTQGIPKPGTAKPLPKSAYKQYTESRVAGDKMKKAATKKATSSAAKAAGSYAKSRAAGAAYAKKRVAKAGTAVQKINSGKAKISGYTKDMQKEIMKKRSANANARRYRSAGR